MASVDSGWAPPAPIPWSLTCLRVDGGGRINVEAGPGLSTPDRVPEHLCADFRELLGLDVRPVVVRSVTENLRSPMGVVTVCEADHQNPRYTTATATGATEVDALTAATLAALGATDDLLAFYAAGLRRSPSVLSVTVVDAGGVRFQEGTVGATAHVAVVGVLPAPGRLTVATRDLEHLILCLPDAAFVATVTAGDPAGCHIETALARIEAAAYDGLHLKS